MAQKVHLLFKLILSVYFLISCEEKDSKSFSSEVDTNKIPKDTISLDNKRLKLNNGVYYLNRTPFSGYIKEVYSKQTVSLGSYFNGKQEGITQTFYPTQKLKDSRNYKEGKAFGRHFGYWENGKIKFDFTYINDKREGLQKQWYETGSSYAYLTFKEDKEEGMQKAWRENGKPYINYEVKEGHRYGIQKSALCYTLRKEKLKSK
jgi:antitoxin component YwqK of YwqJK toxin-antitoxin module